MVGFLLLGRRPPTLLLRVPYHQLHPIAPFSRNKSRRPKDFAEHGVTKTANIRKLNSLQISYRHGPLSLAPSSLSNADWKSHWGL